MKGIWRNQRTPERQEVTGQCEWSDEGVHVLEGGDRGSAQKGLADIAVLMEVYPGLRAQVPEEVLLHPPMQRYS